MMRMMERFETLDTDKHQRSLTHLLRQVVETSTKTMKLFYLE